MVNEMTCDNFIMTEDGERFEMAQMAKGDPGFSPIANVTQEGDITTITITDLQGTTTAEIDNRNKASWIYDTAAGDIVSFPDGADNAPMKALVATIEPVQDLHGYNAPWPSGGGKNLLPMTVDGIKAANTNSTWDGNSTVMSGVTITIPTDDDGNVTGINCNGTASATVVFWLGAIQLESGDAVKIAANTQTDSNVFFRISGPGKGAYDINITSGTYTATSDVEIWGNIRIGSGSTVSNKIFYPVVCKSSTASTDFAPYSNICLITGRAGLTGKRAGENLAYFANRTQSNAGVTFVFVDGVITANGTANGNAYSGNTDMYLNAGTYRVFNLAAQSDGAYILVQNSEDSQTWPTLANTSGSFTDTFTLTRRTKLSVRARIPSGVTATNMVFKPMIVVGTDAPSTFEPYISQNISVNWQNTAGTVYGGIPDVISGRLVVNKGRMVVDGNRSIYNISARTNTVRFAISTNPAIATASGVATTVISDMLPSDPFTFYNQDKLGVCGWNNALWMSIPIEASSTEESIKAWLNANPITCVYPIASPIEYQLTPQEVTTLLGNNVVYTDVGPVSVTAPRDTKMYIDRKIAETVSAALNP